MNDQIRYVTDAAGNIVAVQIPVPLWERLQPLLTPGDGTRAAVEAEAAEPLESFSEFLRFWDFRYPYDPAVRCPHCGQHVADWRTAPGHPFRLTNANFGGLLVFHCKGCGATIRQKHFRDHVALESTPGS